MPKIKCLQPLKCAFPTFYFVQCDGKLNIFRFLIVDQIIQANCRFIYDENEYFTNKSSYSVLIFSQSSLIKLRLIRSHQTRPKQQLLNDFEVQLFLNKRKIKHKSLTKSVFNCGIISEACTQTLNRPTAGFGEVSPACSSSPAIKPTIIHNSSLNILFEPKHRLCTQHANNLLHQSVISVELK